MTITLLYVGFSDYWSGNGRRWDDDAGCVFVPLYKGMTLRDVLNGIKKEIAAGGDTDTMSEDSTSDNAIDEAFNALILDDIDAEYVFGSTEFDVCNGEPPVAIFLLEE
jgi:hypothetical protein